MKKVKDLLREEIVELNKILMETKERLAYAPEGSLRLSKTKKYQQYYHCTDENKTGKYIPKGNNALVCALAQKAYDEKVFNVAGKRKNLISSFIKNYEDNDVEQIFLREHPERQPFIKPIEPPWEEQVRLWKEIPFQGKGFPESFPMILTDRGERVRSKTEKIMADQFYKRGLEYKYECPVYLEGIGNVYPDFTFLSPQIKNEVYWEHFGMVDDPNYARAMVRKINSYENSGIFVGERLIITYETEQTILNSSKINQLINRYLL